MTTGSPTLGWLPWAPVPGRPVGGRARLARSAARTAGACSRVLRGGSGLVIGGRVLMGLAPDAVRRLAHDRRIALVSGTNAKTTTTRLLTAALGGGDQVGSNGDGANTAAGIAGTLARTDAGTMVIEVDEAWLPWAVQQLTPELVVLTNLSRDQLSRHHEVGALVQAWRTALADVPLVVANADDPHVAWAARAARAQVWVAARQTWTADSAVCPRCGGRCQHDGGDWRCAECHLARPMAAWIAEDGVVRHGPEQTALHLRLPGSFNEGNATLAAAAAHALGVPVSYAAPRMQQVDSVAGRYARVRVADHEVRLMLAKNPAGWGELLDLMAGDTHPVVLLLNADGVDGRDTSWLYDVCFSSLHGRRVVVQGRRATDLLVRLQLDGVDAVHVPGALPDALATLPAGSVEVVGNYTAFQTARRQLSRA